MTPIIYLAAPYSHPDLTVVGQRFLAINVAAAKLIADGHIVFSPISMTHPIAMVMGNHLAPAWSGFDEPFMDACAECVVLMLDGWRESLGVAREIAYFTAAGKPVRYMEPEPA